MIIHIFGLFSICIQQRNAYCLIRIDVKTKYIFLQNIHAHVQTVFHCTGLTFGGLWMVLHFIHKSTRYITLHWDQPTTIPVQLRSCGTKNNTSYSQLCFKTLDKNIHIQPVVLYSYFIFAILFIVHPFSLLRKTLLEF